MYFFGVFVRVSNFLSAARTRTPQNHPLDLSNLSLVEIKHAFLDPREGLFFSRPALHETLRIPRFAGSCLPLLPSWPELSLEIAPYRPLEEETEPAVTK